MLPVRIPSEDAVRLSLHASFGRLEVAVGAVREGFRLVEIKGTVAGLCLNKTVHVKDAEIASAIAPSLITGLSKLSESATKGENDLFVDMTYTSKDHDIHETFTVPIKQDKMLQFMKLAGKLFEMQSRKK